MSCGSLPGRFHRMNALSSFVERHRTLLLAVTALWTMAGVVLYAWAPLTVPILLLLSIVAPAAWYLAGGHKVTLQWPSPVILALALAGAYLAINTTWSLSPGTARPAVVMGRSGWFLGEPEAIHNFGRDAGATFFWALPCQGECGDEEDAERYRMRSTEAVEKMQEGNARLKRRGVGDQRQVHGRRSPGRMSPSARPDAMRGHRRRRPHPAIARQVSRPTVHKTLLHPSA